MTECLILFYIQLLKDGCTMLLEPIMRLEIVAPQEYSPSIIADLTRRRAEMQQVDTRGNNKASKCALCVRISKKFQLHDSQLMLDLCLMLQVIDAHAPLSELLGYSTTLRITSSGNATFSLEFSHYQLMTEADEDEAIRKSKGFE